MQLDRLEDFYRVHARIYDRTRRLFLLDRQRALSVLDPRESETVIDFACGTGLNAPGLLREGARVLGIDYSRSMLEQARKRHPSVQFVQADIASCRFSGTADKAVCTYSLSMVENWQDALLNMKAALVPGGRMVILDFSCFRGPLRILYPPFRWWLRRHGVDPEQPITPFLRRHCEEVTVQVLRSGYNLLVSAIVP